MYALEGRNVNVFWGGVGLSGFGGGGWGGGRVGCGGVGSGGVEGSGVRWGRVGSGGVGWGRVVVAHSLPSPSTLSRCWTLHYCNLIYFGDSFCLALKASITSICTKPKHAPLP